MPVTLVTHADYARHIAGAGHPERPARLRAIRDALSGEAWEEHLRHVDPEPVDPHLLTTVHAGRYVEQIRLLAVGGGGHLDVDTVVSPASFEVAKLAAGAAVVAVGETLPSRGRAFALIRPPGHHAGPAYGMGFCLFNNAACAAEAARGLGVRRVCIIDWDVHHGNGTQDIFYRRADVLVCSLHQEHWYPGTGALEETGAGEGAGFTVNIPLPAGTGDQGYRHAFEEVVLPLLDASAPDLLVLCAGYDAHHADPLGGMRLTEAGFAALTGMLLAHHSGPLVAVLEGGYDLAALGRSVAATLSVLAGPGAPAVPESAPEVEVGYTVLRSRIREIRSVVRDAWPI
jgi:acetoin utilization deacetylase AcuC-like enzyme